MNNYKITELERIKRNICYACRREETSNKDKSNLLCKLCDDFFVFFVHYHKKTGIFYKHETRTFVEKLLIMMAELIKQQREILELENEVAIDEGKKPKPFPSHKEMLEYFKIDFGLKLIEDLEFKT